MRMTLISRVAMMAGLALLTGACMSAYDSAEGGYDGYGGYGDTGGDGDQGLPSDPSTPPAEDEEPPVGEDPSSCNATDAVTLYLSPDDSNSMSSPVQAREAVLGGFGSLRDVPIRPWEFMNYYAFDYPAAEAGKLRVTPSLMVPKGAEEGEYTLQIAVTSEALAPEERAPMNLTLVLDTSGSMAGVAMDMLKASSRVIAGSLAEGDVISMVTWDTANQVILGGHEVTGANDEILLGEIDALESGGGTDLHAGLTAGYELALQSYDPARINRIVLVSDGGANAGVTDIETIGMRAGDSDTDGIYMVGVGVGSAESYRDDLMDRVTDAGKGASVFISSEEEAQRVFGDQFISTLDVAARNVAVELEMPPGFSVVRFSGEEISTDPDEVEPQHLAPNDTMIFHQEIETCAPDEVTDDTAFTVTVRYLDGTSFASDAVRVQSTFGELLATPDPLLLKGAAVFAYATALQAQQHGTSDGMADALAALERAETANPEDPDLAEIRAVLEAL